MKNGKVKVFALVSALLLAVCAFAVAACDFTFRTKELTKIEVDSSNVQKVYHPGDDFDENAVKRALVVTAYYDDDTHAKVNSSGFRVVPVNIDHLTTEETQTAGRDTVKVVYGEHESSYDVTITEVTSLRVDVSGLDVSFRQDESHASGEIDHDGLKVYMVYNDGSEELLPADKYTVTADLSKAGNAKATVTTAEEVPVFERGEKDVITGGVVYKRFTAEYDINVIAHNLTGIKFVGEPTTKNYYVGDPFDPKGIQVVGIYEGEGEKPIELSSVKFIADGLEGGVFTKDGEITVTATFGTFTTENSFTVTVDKIRVESISFNSEKSNLNNLKTDYYDDDTFSAAGLVIDVVYNDTRKNKSVEYDSEKTGLEVNAPTMSEGKPQVTVTYTDDYGNATTTYDINVTAVKITKMTVKGIKSFFVGDNFDPTGITATITYNKASLNADVANVSISDDRLTATANNLDENGMLKVGSTVTVTFNDGKHTESVTENINVTAIAIEKDKTSLTVPEKEGGYFVGDEFDITAIKLHVVYNHGDPKDVNGGDAGVEVTVKGLVDGKLTESGEISISVTYTDDNKLTVTKTATITVTAVKLTRITLDTTALNLDGKTFARDEKEYDFTGLIIKAEHNNGKTTDITYKKDETQGVSFSYGDITDDNKRTVTVTYEEGTASATADFTIKVKAAKSINSFYSANMDGANIFNVFVKFVGYTEPEVKTATLNFGETSIAAAENSTIIDGHIHFFFNFGTAKLTVSEDPYDLTVTIGEDTYDVILDETDGTDWDIKAVIGDCEINLKGTKGEKATLTVAEKPVVKNITGFHTAELVDGSFFGIWSYFEGYTDAELNTAVLKIGDLEKTVKTATVLYADSNKQARFSFDLKGAEGLEKGNSYKLSITIGETIYKVVLAINSSHKSIELNGLRVTLVEGTDKQLELKVEDANKPQTFTVTVNDVKGSKGETGTYQLTKKEGGDTVKSGSEVVAGTKLTLTVKPNEGVKATVKVNGSEQQPTVDGGNTYEITVTAATTITITFASATEEPEIPEITVSDVYNANWQSNGMLEVFVICGGIDNDTTKAKAAFTLLIDSTEVEAHDAVQEGNFFRLHYDLSAKNLAAGTYTLKVKVNSKTPFERDIREGNSTYADTANNKTYTIKVVDGHLQLTVTDKVEIKLDDAYNATLESNNGKLTVYIQGNGIANEQVAKDTFTLHVDDGVDIAIADLNDVTKGDVYYSLKFDLKTANLAVQTYSNVSIKYGEGKLQAISSVTSTTTWTDTENNKVYTISAEGGQLTLTVAAKGTKDNPFSVDDVLAKGEELASNEYYKVDGKEQRIFVEGYVVNPGEVSGDYIDGLTISAGGVAPVALTSNTILLYNYQYDKAQFPDLKAGETPYRKGDKLVISGYLQNYGGTTLEICKSPANDYPTIEKWTLPEENAGEEMQEVLDRLVAAYRGAPLNKDGDFTPDVDMRHFITYKVDFSKGPNESEKDIISIDDDKHTLHIAPGDTEVTVTLLITVTCGNTTKTDTVEIIVPVKSSTESVTYKATGTTGGEKVETVSLNDDVTLTFDKGTKSSNAPVYYEKGHNNNKLDTAVIRCYPNNTITLNGENGAIILSVKITYGVAKENDSSPLVETGTNNTVSSGVDISVGENGKGATSVVFKVSNFSGQQVHIGSIEVTYIPGKPLSDEEKITQALAAVESNLPADKTEVTTAQDLPVSPRDDVTFVYSVEQNDYVEIDPAAGGVGALKVVKRPDIGAEDANITVTLTASCNSAKETRTFTIVVPAQSAEAEEPLATFTLGTDNSTKTHTDGSKTVATYNETNGDYTLSITNGVQLYPNSFDAKGNACLKLGSGSSAANFTFTVPEDVKKVKIYIARYKGNAATVTVNNTKYALVKESNNGEYDEIVVDTSSTKSVSVSTGASGDKRCMINTIEFWA